jgi:DNA topoisomerase IA
LSPSLLLLLLPSLLLLLPDKRALYEFVVRHFLASCSKDAVAFETTVTIDIAGEAFRTTGTTSSACNCGFIVFVQADCALLLASSVLRAYLPRQV